MRKFAARGAAGHSRREAGVDLSALLQNLRKPLVEGVPELYHRQALLPRQVERLRY